MIDSLIFENGWGKPTALQPLTGNCAEFESGSAMRSPTREDGRFCEIRISGRPEVVPYKVRLNRAVVGGGARRFAANLNRTHTVIKIYCCTSASSTQLKNFIRAAPTIKRTIRELPLPMGMEDWTELKRLRSYLQPL